jgi:hypothetical protein
MAPAAVEMIGKKKRRRGKKEESLSSVDVPGVHAPKQRKRGAERQLTSTRCVHSSFLYLNSS